MGHYIYPNTALFNPPPNLTSPCQGSDLSSLGRIILEKEGLAVVVVFLKEWQIFPRGCSMPRRPLMLMVCAALLRRSCDGVAALVREVDAVDHHPISPMLVGLAARLQHATPLERGELVYDLMAKRPGEGRRPLNGRDVVHGVRPDRVDCRRRSLPPESGQ